MNRTVQKLISAALLLVMLAGIIACADGGQPAQTDAATDTAAADTTAYTADIPAGTSYGGEAINIYVYDNSNMVWYDVDFSAEEELAETLNDASYTRMRAAEELLDVDLVACPVGNCFDAGASTLVTSIMANNSDYDFGYVNTHATATLSQKGYLYDCNKIQTMDLANPWWDQNIREDLSVANKQYMLTGDIQIMYKKSIGINLFNKGMFADYKLEDPYALVDNHTWTIDKMTELARAVKVDPDVSDDEAVYGLLYQSDLIAVGMIGAGVQFAGKDSDDFPMITLYNDRTESVFSKLCELLLDTSCSTNSHLTDNDHGKLFINNQGLFLSSEFHVIEGLRQMDTDFGLLPMPLYDETQEEYRHTINPHVCAMLVVPIDTPDADRTGYVLEALGAASKNVLTPAYYEVFLKAKGSRDDESEQIIDIVLSTVRYDMGYCYNWGNIGSFTLDLIKQNQTNLASAYGGIESAAERNLDKAISNYQKNN